MNNLRDLDILDVLLRFKHLTDPICTVDSRNFHSSLLNNATELRSLTIEMVFLCPFTWDAQLFRALLKSQLTTLKIYPESVSSRIICGTLNLDKSFLPNYTLKHLYLNSNSCCHLPKIIKYFRGLETLVNYEVCAATVDNIFKYQRQLRRLALINDHKSDFSSRNLSTLCKSSSQ